MKNFKLHMLLLFLSVFLLLPVRVGASEIADLEKEGSLELNCYDEDVPLTGVNFSLYRIASLNAAGELQAEREFLRFQEEMQGKEKGNGQALAFTLKCYALRDNVPPVSRGETNPEGRLSFPASGEKLLPGLYLVVGDRHLQNEKRYDFSPFLVSLPGKDPEKEEWMYDVTVDTKHENQPEPDEPVYISLSVLKIWKDEDYEDHRPNEITIQLLKDGEIYESITLNAGNNWQYTWDELDDAYEWTVVESGISDDYAVSIERDGTTFVITNTHLEDIPTEDPPESGEPPEEPEPPTTPEEPPTSPENPPSNPENPPSTPENPPSTPTDPPSKLIQTGQLWWPVPLLASCGLIFLIIGLIRRKFDE